VTESWWVTVVERLEVVLDTAELISRWLVVTVGKDDVVEVDEDDELDVATALVEGGAVMVEGSLQLQSKQPRESIGRRPS